MVRPGTSPARVTERRAADVLREAADLIEPEGAWTRHELARSASGATVSPSSGAAVCWCVAGAMQRVTGSDAAVGMRSWYQYREALEFFSGVVHWSATGFNDAKGRTQAEVVAALRLAAERCEPDAGDSGTNQNGASK